ncbi:MAG: hypothetical protein LKI27_00980 [Actinomyces sp.]|jgi:hypothetical protein|nr:hypothetical protein [Actinomyces sp.]MCI1661460.1 hypothetical protein [Actinomyces sp.]
MTDTTRERADIVDALTLTPDDWWNLPVVREPDPFDSRRHLNLAVTFPTAAVPVQCLSLTATHDDPVPVLNINADDLTTEDLPVLASTLARVRLIISAIEDDIRLYGDPGLAVPVRPAAGEQMDADARAALADLSRSTGRPGPAAVSVDDFTPASWWRRSDYSVRIDGDPEMPTWERGLKVTCPLGGGDTATVDVFADSLNPAPFVMLPGGRDADAPRSPGEVLAFADALARIGHTVALIHSEGIINVTTTEGTLTDPVTEEGGQQ